MCLNQNLNLIVNVSLKERQLLAHEERMLNRIRVKPPAESFFDSDPKNRCMLDTRVDLIEKLVSFAISESDDTSQRLFMLSGPVGCGKSSVAKSVAYALRQRDCLLETFVFQADRDTKWNPTNFLRTVAYSIALRYEPYRKTLVKALDKDKVKVEHHDPSIQFDVLLGDPLNEMLNNSSLQHPSNQAIIIDALDECSDPESLCSYLVKIIDHCPWIRILVTSRPLEGVEATLCRTGYTESLDLFTVNAHEDIIKFTQTQFTSNGPLHQLQSQVTQEDVRALGKRSHGLFLWITTILAHLDKYKMPSEKLKELKKILAGTAADSEKELDQIYLQVL